MANFVFFYVNRKEYGGHEKMSKLFLEETGGIAIDSLLQLCIISFRYRHDKRFRLLLCMGTVYQMPFACLISWLLVGSRKVALYTPFYRRGRRFVFVKEMWLRFLLSNFVFITISQYEKKIFQGLFHGAVVYIRENPFQRGKNLLFNGIKELKREIFVIGRLYNRQKNISAFLNLARGLDVRVNLIGDADVNSIPIGLARKLCIHGFLQDPWKVVDGILVIPSLYEGVPLVLLEAAERGIPVICNDIPELAQFVSAELLVDFTNQNGNRFQEALDYANTYFGQSDALYRDALMAYGYQDESGKYVS